MLDEATASIDHATDAVIQRVLRERFAGSTVVSVAHRLQTVLDYDRIVVLARGRTVEAGSAVELWRRRGELYEMIMHSGSQRDELIAAIQKLSEQQKAKAEN